MTDTTVINYDQERVARIKRAIEEVEADTVTLDRADMLRFCSAMDKQLTDNAGLRLELATLQSAKHVLEQNYDAAVTGAKRLEGELEQVKAEAVSLLKDVAKLEDSMKIRNFDSVVLRRDANTHICKVFLLYGDKMVQVIRDSNEEIDHYVDTPHVWDLVKQQVFGVSKALSDSEGKEA